MTRFRFYCTLATLLLAVPAVGADIMKPDALLYGVVQIDGAPVSASEDLTVLARVDGLSTPAAVYGMGAQPSAGERYVLRIPIAVQDDGQTPSPNTAQPGQVAKIYVRQGAGPEVYVADAAIPASGEVQELNLSVSAKDLGTQAAPTDGSAGRSAGGCGSGGGMCGGTGMISLGLMFWGLVQMKHRRIRRRWVD